MKKKIDKIIAIAVCGLLGYYLGLAVFKWQTLLLFYQVLPPINNRHLPLYYTGLFGMAIAAPLGYMLYAKFIEKRTVKDYKKQYAIGMASLCLLPLLVLGAFRINAVSIVKQAEGTTPNEINLQLSAPKVTFKISATSGTWFGKSIKLSQNHEKLTAIGTAVQELQLKEVVDSNSSDYATMWITYQPKGKWYSKILTYQEGKFLEAVKNQKFALYAGASLSKILESLVANCADLKNYKQGHLINSKWIEAYQNDEKNPLSRPDYQFVLSFVKDNNKISPDSSTVTLFTSFLTTGVAPEDTNIYAIQLTNEPSDGLELQNFMLYDDLRKVLWFEGKYYTADLAPIIANYTLGQH